MHSNIFGPAVTSSIKAMSGSNKSATLPSPTRNPTSQSFIPQATIGRQRFVVVAEGCCYIFEDELAKEPLHKFSLCGYNRVFRTSSDRNQFCFMLEISDRFQGKSHVFACASEEDRKLWMQAFKGAMLEANAQMISGGDSAGDDDVFKEIEKPLFESVQDDKALPGEGNKETSPSTLPKPAVPPTAPPRGTKNKPLDARKRESAVSPPKVKPPTAEKPHRRLSEKDCLFDNSDREQAINILREKQVPGTFLIRKSRQGDSKVLAVMTAEDVKEYKIFTDNGQVTLDKKSFFRTVDDLLENYSHSPLPNRTQTLGRAYSSHQI
ncbi:hypothetical protein BaRGS_00035726 [Batillaria attramentaria]|uniref:SH2 domain-containing protein n=1 Tax=Batillaria attramentaria TaxID=370345 RepID=A0ABD0JE12_9CAEN